MKLGLDSLLRDAEVMMAGATCVFVPSCGAWLAEHPADPWRLWALGADAEAARQRLMVRLAEFLRRKERVL